ncbi:MAG: MetQ/NlpA family ABC transporter substrate-binding protein [Candidatus Borkfalkiaceae bacterium]|nr:MetQ/NlpA family ABC transporter substrate-binding protein [Clostridia bacterium]MDY6223315.1 MetQ/NlpA family ABC transporter substrate-binding protein [Christensenellaceae bacterium]
MKKIVSVLLSLALGVASVFAVGAAAGCSKDNKITVCASQVPHAEVLNGVVKDELKKKGYTLEVTVLDWTIQNDSVANGDYDANYFQHVPYLETYTGSVELFASCKVHYEPLGIYYGKAAKGTAVTDGKTFEICDDVSNAIRAFQLLTATGVIDKAAEGDNYPVNEAGDALTIGDAKKSWTSADGEVTVTLVAENLLVQSKGDYDFACLPCNTAYTGNVTADQRAAVEDDPAQVAGKANIIAARLNDYKNDEKYKEKIDALTEVMLSKAVSDYFAEKYLGSMTCDSSTQIDLRSNVK